MPISGLPEGCLVERATHPEEVWTPTWEACGDGLDWCQHLPFETLVLDEGCHDGTRGYFLVLFGDEEGHRIVAFASTDQPAWAALRSGAGRPSCEHSIYGISPDAAGASVMIFTGDGGQAALHGTRAGGWADGLAAILSVSDLGGPAVIQNVAVSSTTMALDVQPTARIYLWEDSAVARAAALPGDTRTPYFHPVVIGHDVLAMAETSDGYVRIARVRAGELPEVYHEVSSAETLALATDGRDLGWLQVYRNPDWSVDRVEVWTAPYVPLATDLRPRPLGRVPEVMRRITVGGGRIAYHDPSTTPSRMVIFELASGRVLALEERADLRFGAVPYVSATELFFDGAGAGFGTRTGFRIDLTTAPLIDVTAEYATSM